MSLPRFRMVRPDDAAAASAFLAGEGGGGDARILAGGQDLLTVMKSGMEAPGTLVDLKRVPGMREIKVDGSGARVGALATLAELEDSEVLHRREYAVLAEAAALAATPQIRNRGTLGGNLCQRPRCEYLRHPDLACAKSTGDPSAGCPAERGRNRHLAILGRGGPCNIAHPSDLAPALIALDASARILGTDGERTEPVADLFASPSERLDREVRLAPDDVITAVEMPAPPPGTRTAWEKAKEKQSLDFALASAAASVTLDGGVCRRARIVLGGVAPTPLRVENAEAALVGAAVDRAAAERAAEAAVAGARPMSENGYKVPLTRALVRRAVLRCVEG